MKSTFANSKVVGHRPRVGLALSSGGARGLAHVGVIQVLEEAGIPVDVVAGASMGAYVGSLWSAGYGGEELYHFAAEIARPRDLWRRLDLAILPVKGLFHGHGVRRRLESALHGMKFSELCRELHVVAANLDTLERQIFTSGDVARAVHASFAIPGICVPVEIDGCRYVDGGVVDPLPVGILKRAGCDVVIAVTVIPRFSEMALCKPAETTAAGLVHRGIRALNRALNVFAKGNVVDTLRASLYAAQIRIAHASEAQADVVVRAVRHTNAWHDYHHYEDYIETGRQAAELVLPQIRALLSTQIMKGQTHETEPESCLVG
jgi:NTE family protein